MGKNSTKIRYAVIGLGHIAQVAVLPAFKNAENSELVALISSDPEKLKRLSRKYKVECVGNYDDLEQCLDEAAADAVYIATPNTRHKEFVIRASRMGVHSLCEKPLATTVRDCEAMIESARKYNVKLMTAYRLHFDAANLEAIEIAKSGRLGELRYFTSDYSMQIKEGNIRLQKKLGGGPLFDIGIYCINAARYIFRSEPETVMAMSVRGRDPRFKEVDEMVAALMRFPGGMIANFTSSFGASRASYYEIVGTKGKLRVEPAFSYTEELKHKLTLGGKTTTKTFAKRDQFAAELVYFSDCIAHDKPIEPSGEEGLADIRVIEAINESARTGRACPVRSRDRELRPDIKQCFRKPPVKPPQLVHVSAPSLN